MPNGFLKKRDWVLYETNRSERESEAVATMKTAWGLLQISREGSIKVQGSQCTFGISTELIPVASRGRRWFNPSLLPSGRAAARTGTEQIPTANE
jgi:hypothetical protein